MGVYSDDTPIIPYELFVVVVVVVVFPLYHDDIRSHEVEDKCVHQEFRGGGGGGGRLLVRRSWFRSPLWPPAPYWFGRYQYNVTG